MRVICAGMRRAGSTWLYNTARVLVSQDSGEPAYGCFEDAWEYSQGGPRAQVVKTHRFDASWLFGAEYVLTIHRDPRDVARSAVAWGLVEDKPVQVVRWLTKTIADEHDQWEPYAILSMCYEEVMNDTEEATASVAERLALASHVDIVCVAKFVDALPIPQSSRDVDPEVLLHPLHRTPKTLTLRNETVRAVEAVFGEWMTEHGYAV